MNILGMTFKHLCQIHSTLLNAVKDADLVVGAVLIPGAKAPKLVTEEMVKSMKPGSVIVDIAIDQGGIFETSDRVTTHDDPTLCETWCRSLCSCEYAGCSSANINNWP